MNNEMNHNEVWEAFMAHIVQEVKERLWPLGTGEESCFPAAKRRGQDGTEERSREGSRVSPVEAMVAERAIRKFEALAGRHAQLCEQPWIENEGVTRAHFHRCLASAYQSCADFIVQGLPKPDSKIAKQASGRRNAEVRHGAKDADLD